MKLNKKLVLAATTITLMPLLGGCATWERFKKDWNSEFDNGLPREIQVYDISGKLIFKDRGKFDISHKNHKLQYVDNKNRKHNIYTGDNTTVVVKELDEKDLK